MTSDDNLDLFSLRAAVVAATDNIQSGPEGGAAWRRPERVTVVSPLVQKPRLRLPRLWLGGLVAARDAMLAPVTLLRLLLLPNLLVGLWCSLVKTMREYLASQVPNAAWQQDILLLTVTLIFIFALCAHVFAKSVCRDSGLVRIYYFRRIIAVAINLIVLLLLVALTVAIVIHAFIIILRVQNAVGPKGINANVDVTGAMTAAAVWIPIAVSLISPMSLRLVSSALSTQPSWPDCWRRCRGHRLACFWIIFSILAPGIAGTILIAQIDIIDSLFPTGVTPEFLRTGLSGVTILCPIFLTFHVMGTALSRFNRSV